MEKILVTGGAGFIGSHLVKRLVQDGNEVVVADIMLRGNKIESDILKKCDFHNADVRDADAMMELSKGCSKIYHFAAVLGVDVVADNPVETMDTEVIGMRNIANAAITHGINKIIYASTSGIYGHSAISQSGGEKIVVDPRTSYAIAKRYNEIYLGAQFDEKGLESVCLRFFNVYGKNQDNRMVIPRFIEQAQDGQGITVFGNGKQTRDFTYVDDAVEACIRLSENMIGSEIYNIACGEETTIHRLAKAILEATESSSEIKLVDAPKKRYDYEVERRYGNSDKLFNKTGFRPNTKLVEGLRTTIGK